MSPKTANLMLLEGRKLILFILKSPGLGLVLIRSRKDADYNDYIFNEEEK